MKKNVKMIVALALAVIMVMASQESFLANDQDWNISTTSSVNQTTEIVIPYYEGDITYKLTSLSGNCTYLVAECQPNAMYAAYYWMNNTAGCIRLTKPAEETFRMGFSSLGKSKRPDVSFIMYIDHNASAASNISLSAKGKICY